MMSSLMASSSSSPCPTFSTLPKQTPLKRALNWNPYHARSVGRVPAATDTSAEVKESGSGGGGDGQNGGCPACGKAEMEKGCDGTGRIQGGIGTIPGFGWWPIMAYRPCPALVKSGRRYQRKGQSLDEVAFGRKSKGDDLDISERLK